MFYERATAKKSKIQRGAQQIKKGFTTEVPSSGEEEVITGTARVACRTLTHSSAAELQTQATIAC